MVQEFICGKMLKKDYEEAARQRAENEAREKEEEKQRKREAAERRAREKEEAKKHKKAAPKQDEAAKQERAVAEVSRVGMRNYARGRAYDPNRFGGVTPYHDPSAVDESAIAAALAAKDKKEEKTSGVDEEAIQAALAAKAEETGEPAGTTEADSAAETGTVEEKPDQE